MTCIAYDGKDLAGDKSATLNGYPLTITKVHRVQGGRVGFAGCSFHAQQLLAWFKGGRIAADYPKTKEGADGAQALFVDDVRRELLFFGDGNFIGLKIEQKFTAIGSGRDFAIAAMHLGKTAGEAIEVACKFDIYCGQGIDVLEPRCV